MDVHVEIAAETLFHVGPIPITNSQLTMFIVMGFLILFGWRIAKNAREIPGKSQSVLEMIVEFLMGLVVSTAGKKLGRQIFPLIGAIFIFIIFANYSGLLPGVGTVGFYHTEEAEHSTEETHSEAPGATTEEPEAEGTAEEGAQVRVFDIAATGAALTSISAPTAEKGEGAHSVLVPFLRPPNADINMTLAMALVTFTSVQIFGIKAHGVGGRLKHMANPAFIFPIEVISEFSRIISLSARLFGNVFAGEVLLGVMYAMSAAIKVAIVPFLFPVAFLFLEVMFGAIQALVFSLLTLIYITLAAEGGHDDEHAHGHGAAAPGHGVQPAAGHAD